MLPTPVPKIFLSFNFSVRSLDSDLPTETKKPKLINIPLKLRVLGLGQFDVS